MADLANPKNIYGAFPKRAAATTSYFGLPAKLNDYETDPAKLGDTTKLSGSLGGLLKAGVNMVANAGVNTYNAVAATGADNSTYAERNAAFAAPYQEAPRASGLKAMPAHTVGASLTPRFASGPQAGLGGSVSVPVPRTAGLTRRVAAPQAPAGIEIPTPQPTVSWNEQNPAENPAEEPAIPVERGYIEQGGLKMYVPGSQAATPGISYSSDKQFEGAPTGAPQPGGLGWQGSQAQWERDQELNNLVNTHPFGLKIAKVVQEQNDLAERTANNLRTHGVSQQNADTNQLYQGTLAKVADTMLPENVAKARSELLNDMFTRGLIGEQTKGLYLGNKEIPADHAARRESESASAYAARSGAAIAQAKLAPEIANLTATAGLHAATAASLPDKYVAAQEAAAARTQAVKDKEVQNYMTNDPEFTKKFGAVGSELDRYKAAELIAASKGLVFKSKPFKSGLLRKSNPAGYYTADGQPVPMTAMVEEYLKRQGTK